MEPRVDLPFLLIGAFGDVGRDICTYFNHHRVAYTTFKGRLTNAEEVEETLWKLPDRIVVNLAFDKTLQNEFTNIELPACIEQAAKHRPIYLSSNAVYGLGKRRAGTGDDVRADGPYAEQKINAEAALKRSHIVRASFLASSHRIFHNPDAQINAHSVWNGITAFEFARLLENRVFTKDLTTLASADEVTWAGLAERFDSPARHNQNLPLNQCVLRSDLGIERLLEDQLAELQTYLRQGVLNDPT